MQASLQGKFTAADKPLEDVAVELMAQEKESMMRTLVQMFV